MGDVVLQTATVNWLRSLFGEALRITFVTSEEFKTLIEDHPGIDGVVTFNRRGGEKWKDFLRVLDQLDGEHPIDLILDLHATLRSFKLRLSLWTIPALTVDKRRWERFLLTKIKSVRLKRVFKSKIFGLEPQVERIIKDFDSLFGGTQGVRKVQEYRKGPHKELTSLGNLPEYPLQRPYIVLSPSASFFYKRWPLKYYVELARKILNGTHFHVVVLAGKDDTFCEAFNEIQSDRLHNLQGKTTLKESMSVLKGSVLCVGNDSGMNHIAEAAGVPVLTLFGPTDPRFGFAPHGEKSSFIVKELWCSPCSTTGKEKCFRDQHYCMEMITVEEVLNKTLSMLGGL